MKPPWGDARSPGFQSRLYFQRPRCLPAVSPSLWTVQRNGEVLLRLSKHGPGHETPMTIPEFFRNSVNRFGAYPALASKNSRKWEILNFNQYYEACRRAARALLKVRPTLLQPLAPRPGQGARRTKATGEAFGGTPGPQPPSSPALISVSCLCI